MAANEGNHLRAFRQVDAAFRAARQHHGVKGPIEAGLQGAIRHHWDGVIAHHFATLAAGNRLHRNIQAAQDIDSDNRFPLFKTGG